MVSKYNRQTDRRQKQTEPYKDSEADLKLEPGVQVSRDREQRGQLESGQRNDKCPENNTGLRKR